MPKVKFPTANPGEVDGGILDRFTLSHLLFGMAGGSVGIPKPYLLAFSISYEFFERWRKDNYPDTYQFKTQDRLINSISDVCAFMAGAYLTSRR